MKTEIPASPPESSSPLLTDRQLLAALWPDATSRPSTRWFRSVRAAGGVPVVRILGKSYFDPTAVRAALTAKYATLTPGAK